MPSRSPISRPEYPRAFPALFTGSGMANAADGILLAIAPLLAATLTRDPVLVSGVVVAQRLPWLLFGMFSGVVVDRFPRRTMITIGNLLRMVALAVLAVTLAFGAVSLPLLYAAIFVAGSAETLVDNASLSVLPELVRRERLHDANARLFTAQSVLNELAGPPLGGLLFSVSAVAAFATGSLFFLAAAALFLLLPRQRRNPAPREPLRIALVEGLRAFWRVPALRVFVAIATVLNFASGAAMGVLVLLAQERLGLGDAGYGLLLIGAALGGIPGGLLAPLVIRIIGEGPTMVLSTLLPAFCYALLAATRSPVVASLALGVAAFASMHSNVVSATLRQATVPNHLLGRVAAVYRMIAIGSLALGGIAGGVVAGAFGLPAPYWMGAAMVLLLVLSVSTRLRTRDLRALIEAASRK